MSSYKQLTGEQQKQVDVFMANLASRGILSPMDELEYAYVEEQASKLVLTYVRIEKQTPPIKRMTGKYYY